ncbi:30S ribosomal protein S4 [Candidatus Woesearchaeota archaeon]|nr:30S ribosomal protein S4 [Candidatus Woesearchaeota archaeon]
MGDPKRIKKKYSTPIHPWQAERIEEERELTKQYGFKNKKEIWKENSILRNFLRQAKRLTAIKTEQSEKEKIQLLDRLKRLGLLTETAMIDDVLDISLKDLLERRLQTLVFRRGLARSMKQARQFIIHRHIIIGNKKITVPSYLVSKAEESIISFSGKSSLVNPDHPERKKEEVSEMPKKPEKKSAKKVKEGKKPKKEKKVKPKKEEKSEESPKPNTSEEKKE